MIKTTDIAWLGGLLEGEGCFQLQNKKYPLIVLQMTAEDTVVRAATLMESKIYRCGNIWNARTAGVRAIQWMMTLYPFLGKCRQKKVTKIIRFWREYTYTQAPRGIRLMATCHPDKIAMGPNQLCKTCHIRQYKAKRYSEKKLLRKVG